MKGLAKPKRKQFITKYDYEQALQVYALCKLALSKGATIDECREVLKQESGGFLGWDWMFPL